MTVTAESGSVSSTLVVTELAVTDVDFAAGTFVVTGPAGATFDAVIGRSGCGYNGALLDPSGTYTVSIDAEFCGFDSSPAGPAGNRIYLSTPARNPGLSSYAENSTTIEFRPSQ